MSQVKKNYFYNLIYQVVVIIIPFITIPYLSRVLGSTLIGDYDYTAGIVAYFGIFALTGTQHYGQREIAIVQEDKENRSRIFLEVFLFRLICTLVMLVLYIVFIHNFLPEYRFLFLIQLITFASWMLDISWYFQGMENFKVIVIRNLCIRVLILCLILLLVRTREDLWKYAVILTSSTLIGNLSLWINIKKTLSRTKLRDLNLRRHVKGIVALFIPVIAIQVYAILDKTMLGTIVNTTEVGYYSQAEKLVKVALTVFTALTSVLIPRIAAVYAKGENELVKGYFEKACSFLAFVSMPMMIGLIAISDVFVPVFYGDDFLPVVNLLRILSLLFPILGMGQLVGGFMIAIKNLKTYNTAVISAAIVNVLLNYIFLVSAGWASIGVSIATVAAELTCTTIQLVVISKTINIKKALFQFIRYLIPSLIMGGVILVIKAIILKPLPCVIVSVAIGIAIYAVILIATKDKIAREVIDVIKSKIRYT